MRKLFKERKLFKGGNYMRKYGRRLKPRPNLVSMINKVGKWTRHLLVPHKRIQRRNKSVVWSSFDIYFLIFNNEHKLSITFVKLRWLCFFAVCFFFAKEPAKCLFFCSLKFSAVEQAEEFNFLFLFLAVFVVQGRIINLL